MTDRVIEEIRERRRDLMKTRYGGSVERLVAASRKWQQTHARKVESLRRAVATAATA